MSNAIPWTSTTIDYHRQAHGRLATVVYWQVGLASVAAFISQTMIFDEANWYRIDLYDAFTWGLIVTQVFALAVYVSRNRVQSVQGSLRVFLTMGGLAAGLTTAATAFLVVDATRNNREVFPLLLIAPGYCIAVFVFLVSMFLQMRLAIICLHSVRPLLSRKRSSKFISDESISQEPIHEGPGATEKYSIADIFAFTGLAAVSISAYRLVLGMVTDYDALRFLAMFYAASVTAFCVYVLLQLNCSRWLKLILILAIVFAIAYSDFYIAQTLRSPLLRFGFTGMLLCNYFIAIATTMQLWLLHKLRNSSQ